MGCVGDPPSDLTKRAGLYETYCVVSHGGPVVAGLLDGVKCAGDTLVAREVVVVFDDGKSVSWDVRKVGWVKEALGWLGVDDWRGVLNDMVGDVEWGISVCG